MMDETQLKKDWRERCRYHPDVDEREQEVLDGVSAGALAFGEYLISVLVDGPELRRALNKIWEAKTLANCSALVRGVK